MKEGIGLLEQIQKSSTYKYEALEETDIVNWVKIIQDSENELNKIRKESHERILKNLKYLEEKSKKLNKEIPQELYIRIYWDQPTGSWFFKKYEEWFKE